MLNLLVSKPYMTNGLVEYWDSNRSHIRMIVDSGAFTNWKAGKETSVDEYMAFIDGLPVKPWGYFTLDRIGDPITTKDNYQTMISNGFDPIPIFTRGTPISELDSLYEQNEVVGIGVGVGSNNYLGYLKHVVEQNRGRNLHWLGVAIPSMIANYKPYSCDASSWESGGRYGSIQVYQGGGKFTTYRRQHANTRPPDPTMWRSIRLLGFDPRELQRESSWRGGYINLSRRIGAGSWIKYSMDVEAKFGTRIFLALTSLHGISLCVEEYLKVTKV